VSHTSRQPRAGEQDGREYHFRSKEEIRAAEARGEFLEVSEVHGNVYGTSRAAVKTVRESGKVCIIELDYQGAQKLKCQQGNLNFLYVFIKAPCIEELERRMKNRAAESAEKIATRLETARKEMAFVELNQSFFDKVFTNENLEETYKELKSLLSENSAL